MCKNEGLEITYQSNVRLIKMVMRGALARPFNRLHFGPQYGLMNSVIIAVKP